MQDSTVDKKIEVIYDNYRDNLYAQNAQQEVEAIRRKATYTGAGITLAAFVGNEVSRLTLRSRKLIECNLLIHHISFSTIQVQGTKCGSHPAFANVFGQENLQ